MLVTNRLRENLQCHHENQLRFRTRPKKYEVRFVRLMHGRSHGYIKLSRLTIIIIIQFENVAALDKFINLRPGPLVIESVRADCVSLV